jgi:hypothetical protein
MVLYCARFGKEDVEMYDPLTLWVVDEYQKERLEKAKQNRLVESASAPAHWSWDWLFVRVGDVLIAAGSSLHRRFEPAA